MASDDDKVFPNGLSRIEFSNLIYARKFERVASEIQLRAYCVIYTCHTNFAYYAYVHTRAVTNSRSQTELLLLYDLDVSLKFHFIEKHRDAKRITKYMLQQPRFFFLPKCQFATTRGDF
uniref:Uncharacterized protein n=1 Tax=Trichogramma kaykai TaxID=54128 RepID=A0ABD2WR02_9HYME